MGKLAVFGGTGMTGLCAVEHALKRGLEVRALARDPKRFPEELRQKIEVIEGDVLNLSDVEKTLEGVDGVVVVLGTRNDVRPTTLFSEGAKNIVAAMKTKGVKPVSACFSAFLFKLDQTPPVFKALTEDHVRMLEVLKGSDRDWVAVCPPHISAETGEKYVVKNGESPGRVVSKHDLGAFLVDCIAMKEHYHQQVGIATPAAPPAAPPAAAAPEPAPAPESK